MLRLHVRALLLCSKACQASHWVLHKGPCRSSPVYLKKQEITKLKRTLKKQQETLGVEHSPTLATLSQLGVLLQRQGRLPESELFHRRAFSGRFLSLGS